MASVDRTLDQTGDSTCGISEDNDIYGKKDYVCLSKDSSIPDDKVKLRVSHCLIFAKNNANDTRILGMYHPIATILMQVRFDGYLGFPGGIIDDDEDPVFSLNREMQEEMHLDLTKFSVKPSNHVIAHFNEKTGLLLYFFALEVSMDELKKIETDALQAEDYGSEVLGTIRVPLCTLSDGYRGFPAFLGHNFIGIAREQLLYTIKHLKLLTEEEIQQSVQASKKKK